MKIFAGRSLALFTVVLVCATAVATPVRAHPALDRAVKLAGEAEFDRALAAFDRALRSGTLTRNELVVLLTERALVRFAVDNARGMEEDLRYLALLAPDTELGQRAPPGMLVVWQSARSEADGPLGLTLSAVSVPGGMRVTAAITGYPQPEDLQVRLSMRSPDEEAWQTLNAREARYPAPSGGELQYYGELVGLGDVVVASAGSRPEPLTHVVQSASQSTTVLASGGQATTTRSDRSSSAKWWWIGGGGVVAVAAAVTLGVVLAGSRDSNQTLVEAPMVDL